MSKFLVAVVDKTKARLFKLEEAELLEQSSPNLVELKQVWNPVQEHVGRELWANTKTGRNRGSASQAHSYDDHRQNHMDEFERRFAQAIASEIVDLAQTHHVRQMILVAEAQILGYMRQALAPTLPKTLKIQELAKDLGKLTSLEIHNYLADKKLLPVRSRISR